MTDTQAFRGIFTPLVTPLNRDETIDHSSLCRLIDFQIDQGVHGLWLMGTTGEFASFSGAERASACEVAVSHIRGRVPVIVNVSDCATRLAAGHGQEAKRVGANAVAATPPYYFPHSQAELLEHFRTIAATVDLPLFLYNIPQTVRTNLGMETAVTLAEEGTVAGIKDSQNDLEWFRELTLRASRTAPTFRAFAGTRHLIDAGVLAGAVGAIPSLANAYPKLCVDTYEAAATGNFERSRSLEAEIVDIEARAQPGRGSKNGAVIGALKAHLVTEGIIATATLTRPLLAD